MISDTAPGHHLNNLIFRQYILTYKCSYSTVKKGNKKEKHSDIQ